VEGAFGTGKTAYGLGRIFVRLEETTCCVIGMALLMMNLMKGQRSLLPSFSLPFLLPFSCSFYSPLFWGGLPSRP